MFTRRLWPVFSAASLLVLFGSGFARDRGLITGKVVFADGSAPQLLVEVGLVCDGVEQPRVYADSAGWFRIAPPAGHENCSPRAYLAGYRSEGPAMGSTNVALKPLGKQPAAMKSSRDKDALKNSRTDLKLGLNAASKADWKDAEAWFEEAKTVSPWFASAWYNLGVLEERRGDIPAAKSSYKAALKQDEGLILARLQLAGVEIARQDWKEALADCKIILDADPLAFPRAYLLNAQANLNVHQTDEAEKSAREGIKLDDEKRYPELHYILGLVLIDKGDRSGAMAELQAYLKLDPSSPAAAEARGQIAHIQAGNP